jgi:hypothetical protein
MRDRVANVLLALTARGSSSGTVGRAAEELARGASREALGPLLDAACSRLGAVLLRAHDVAADLVQLRKGEATAAAQALCRAHAWPRCE